MYTIHNILHKVIFLAYHGSKPTNVAQHAHRQEGLNLGLARHHN